MKHFILCIWVFILSKFAPKIIDSNSNEFWLNFVTTLNMLRTVNGDKFYLFKIWKIYIRDPYSYPVSYLWVSSRYHPFCWKK